MNRSASFALLEQGAPRGVGAVPAVSGLSLRSRDSPRLALPMSQDLTHGYPVRAATRAWAFSSSPLIPRCDYSQCCGLYPFTATRRTV
ncbi:hypothetical protein GCM10028832_11350 [Streptomyces sparsus]